MLLLILILSERRIGIEDFTSEKVEGSKSRGKGVVSLERLERHKREEHDVRHLGEFRHSTISGKGEGVTSDRNSRLRS